MSPQYNIRFYDTSSFHPGGLTRNVRVVACTKPPSLAPSPPACILTLIVSFAATTHTRATLSLLRCRLHSNGRIGRHLLPMGAPLCTPRCPRPSPQRSSVTGEVPHPRWWLAASGPDHLWCPPAPSHRLPSGPGRPGGHQAATLRRKVQRGQRGGGMVRALKALDPLAQRGGRTEPPAPHRTPLSSGLELVSGRWSCWGGASRRLGQGSSLRLRPIVHRSLEALNPHRASGSILLGGPSCDSHRGRPGGRGVLSSSLTYLGPRVRLRPRCTVRFVEESWDTGGHSVKRGSLERGGKGVSRGWKPVNHVTVLTDAFRRGLALSLRGCLMAVQYQLPMSLGKPHGLSAFGPEIFARLSQGS
jgi:hypothetical protein